MPRRQRLHVPGGLYYLEQHNGPNQPLFLQCGDYDVFEQLLHAALERTASRVYAYCWTTHAIHLLVQIDETPLSSLMQGLNTSYAHHMHRGARMAGPLFQHRYRSVLLDPETYLLCAVRYLHHLPVLLQLSATPDDYSHTSHSAYRGAAATPWLSTGLTLRSLRERFGFEHPYDELISRPPLPREVELFKLHGISDTKAIGSADFMASLPYAARHLRSHIGLDQLIRHVCLMLDVDSQYVFSFARNRKLVLARAVIAWHAKTRGLITLSEFARQCRRQPSSLSEAINRYRRSHPELFRPNALQHLVPLLHIPSQAQPTSARDND